MFFIIRSRNFQNLVSDLYFLKLDYKYDGFNNLKVHGGFYLSYQHISDKILKIINDILNNNDIKKITVLGHSLGGVYAIFLTLDLILKLKIKNKITSYTYGEPRIGNLEFSKFIRLLIRKKLIKIIRFTNKRDPIPHIPLNINGFYHHYHEIWFSKNKFINCNDKYKEDKNCSNKIKYLYNIVDHWHFLNVSAILPCY